MLQHRPFLAALGATLLLVPNPALSQGLNILNGTTNSAPPGYEEYTSPLVVPSPNVSGSGDWAAAVVKARAFVKGLTLDELVNITTGAGADLRCNGNTGEITRLGFAGFCMEDSPTGVRQTDFTSGFPPGINTASTWDRDLIRQRGAAIGAEERGKGINLGLGPMMNMGRAVAAGRAWEGFGGDPYLTGVCASETVKGIQSAGVIATAKHFLGNEQEHYRGGSGNTSESSNIDDRTMHEIYGWPFAESVKAGVGSVMCSYQRVNQTYSCENSKLLNGFLKEELDFQGFVMSDWGAIESGVNSVLAGADMDMPGFYAYGDVEQYNPATSNDSFMGAHLVQAVQNGSVPLTRVQDMVTRIFSSYYQMGQDKDFPKVNFNSNATMGDLNEHVDVQGDHREIIREIGAASAVLLKNVNNTLPLSATAYRKWGLFGSDAGYPLLGPDGCPYKACLQQGTLTTGWGSGSAELPYIIDPLSAIQAYVHSTNPRALVQAVLADWKYDIQETLAEQEDICLVFIQAASGEAVAIVEGNYGDRNNLTAWNGGDALIANVASFCSNTVVIMHTVGPIIMEDWVNHPNVTAILSAGLPGQETGNSLVDVLFGAVNPSARLPYTIARQRSDYSADVLYESNMTVPQITYSEKLLVDYKWFDAKNITPTFEFGFGLSYTTFAYSSLDVKAASSSLRRTVQQVESSSLYDTAYTFSYTVKNTGKVGGNEVSQLYLGFPASAGEPPLLLRGFDRSYLKVGASTRVTLSVNKKEISIWDVVSQAWVVPSGTFTVNVGQSSRKILLTGSFEV